ncbi:mucin-19 [Schistocerca serialis cubense]|uniref:mucin-19 n=1 Tax=Schistocerca serialis cubense TaxID=2023355 RepID=UPI00214F2AFB|nr:mucin-19 [Schistocerca serialis cubense]
MLSYMLPVEEKPPLPKNMQLQLELRGVRASATDSSVSTTSSSADTNTSTSTSATATAGTPTPTADPAPAPPPAKTHRNKLVVNGTKHPPLKRVSFGSSKGSMVETLIYESPVQEEPEASPILEDATPFPADADSESEPSKRVRVTFFESLRPLVVSSPSPEPNADLVEPAPLHAATPLAVTMATAVAEHTTVYTRQESTDSGWDNPFRPDGDLSREADEIVELIKGGKPITPTPGSTAPQLPEPAAAASAIAGDGKAAAAANADGAQSPQLQQQQQQLQAASPQLAAKQASPLQQQVANSKPAAGAGANGNAPGAAANAAPDSKPAAVEVQRGTVVQPSDASQVEHVVIKKKPKCKCCVIQ